LRACGHIARGHLIPTRVGAYADGFRLLLRQLSANDGIAVNVPGFVAGSTPLIDSDRGRMNHDTRRSGRGDSRGVSGEMCPPRYCSAECLFCLAMASAPAVAVGDSQSVPATSEPRLPARAARAAAVGQLGRRAGMAREQVRANSCGHSRKGCRAGCSLGSEARCGSPSRPRRYLSRHRPRRRTALVQALSV
jgi:hypothetical protein